MEGSLSTDEEKDAWVFDTFGVDPRTYPKKAAASAKSQASPGGRAAGSDEIIAILVANKAQDKAGVQSAAPHAAAQPPPGADQDDGLLQTAAYTPGEIGKPSTPGV